MFEIESVGRMYLSVPVLRTGLQQAGLSRLDRRVTVATTTPSTAVMVRRWPRRPSPASMTSIIARGMELVSGGKEQHRRCGPAVPARRFGGTEGVVFDEVYAPSDTGVMLPARVTPSGHANQLCLRWVART